jgi:hypothetical protein
LAKRWNSACFVLHFLLLSLSHKTEINVFTSLHWFESTVQLHAMEL